MRRASPSVADVARAAGVSLGTVSNVLNRPEKVSPQVRTRVEAAIAQLGFVRNNAARNLRMGRSSTIGFVIQDLSNSFFLDMVRGAEEEAGRWGTNVLLANSDGVEAKQQAYVTLFEQERLGGVLVAPTPGTIRSLDPVRDRGLPIVVLNEPEAVRGFCAVTSDNRHGGYLAASHLIGLGRTRLLFAGADQFQAVRARFEGARLAVAETEGAVRLERVHTDGVRIEDGREVGAQLNRRRPDDVPDGLLAGADLLAFGAVQALLLGGRLRIPEDVAIVGYDNNRSAWNSVVPITTLDQVGEEMGRTAARLLRAEMTGPPAHAHSTVTLSPVLVPRRSTLGA